MQLLPPFGVRDKVFTHEIAQRQRAAIFKRGNNQTLRDLRGLSLKQRGKHARSRLRHKHSLNKRLFADENDDVVSSSISSLASGRRAN